MSSRTNRKQKHTSNGSWGMVNVGLTILYAILALVLLFTMFNYNFLSFRFLNIIITIGLLVVLATGQLTSYAMPNSSLYMMKLDNSSVESASQAIKKLMEEK